jgi:gamma-glutamylcyclotransferase (GGCT)/AIG2-like uncharacterized protein YtfP
VAHLFLNGGGMRDGPVHHELQGAPLVAETRTAPRYRFYSVRDEFPALWPVEDGGVAVAGELYDVPLDVMREHLLPAEPAELELSVIQLEDGSSCLAFVLRADVHRLGRGLVDISGYGGWRAHQAASARTLTPGATDDPV